MTTRVRGRDMAWDVEEAIAGHFDEARRNGEKNIAAYVGRELSNDPKFRDRVPVPRTLQRAVKDIVTRYDRLTPKSKTLDQRFEWHRLDEYGLPWEAGSYLLDMWREIKELGALLHSAHLVTVKHAPTVRQARWWWRVHLAVPEMEVKLNVYLWAEEICRQELYRDLLEKPMDLAGIDAYLAYQPWASPENEAAYTAARREDRIPGLPDSFDETISRDAGAAVGPTPAGEAGEVSGYRPETPAGIDALHPGREPVENMKQALERYTQVAVEVIREREARIAELEAATGSG